MKARAFGLWGLVLAAGGMLACGTGAAAPPAVRSGGTAYAGPAAQPNQAAQATQPAAGSATKPLPVVTGNGPRVIRSAQLRLEVGRGTFDSTLRRLIDLAQTEGGYVSATNAGTDPGDQIRTGTVTFAIPVEHFQDTVDRLRGIGKLQSINVTAQDVSRQYVDLQARLANAEAQRDAMLALLQRATSISDIIQIQNQLGTITGQIEQLKGQIAYLDQATSYSTIQVTLREAGVAAAPADEWGLRSAFLQGLHNFVQTLDALVLVLVTIGPYVLLVAAGLLLWRTRRPAAPTRQ